MPFLDPFVVFRSKWVRYLNTFTLSVCNDSRSECDQQRKESNDQIGKIEHACFYVWISKFAIAALHCASRSAH